MSFDPYNLRIGKLDKIEFNTHTYDVPTEGFLDLQDLGEVDIQESSFEVTVYSVSGYTEGDEIMSLIAEEYSIGDIMYVSDVWIAEEYRREGLGTQLFENLIQNSFTLYLYASTEAMKAVAQNIGYTEFESGWFKNK